MSRRARIALVAMTLARLILALGMMPYCISKLFDYQFQVSAWNYARPLGELPGPILTWAFLGYSPVFQFLMGVFETIPTLLLLSTRTRRLGALLLFPVLLNVVMINYFLDLWPGTKMISSVLLGFNIFLILYDLPLYLSLLKRLISAPVPIASARLRMTSNVAAVAIPAVLIGAFAYYFFHEQVGVEVVSMQDFIGTRQINRAGTWQVEFIKVSGRPVAMASGSLFYFDFTHRCVYSNGDRPSFGRFKVDRSQHSFEITGIPVVGSSAAIRGNYKLDGQKLLLEGQRDNQPISLLLIRHWGNYLRSADLTR
jgi:hypothetical protein